MVRGIETLIAALTPTFLAEVERLKHKPQVTTDLRQ